jgi:hypothetical protein
MIVSKRLLITSIVICGVALAAAGLLLYINLSNTCGLRVVNDSGETLHEVEVIITALGSGANVNHQYSEIAQGEELCIDPRANDWSLKISYSMGGEIYSHTNNTVDLWTGETWQLVIGGSGAISEDYGD